MRIAPDTLVIMHTVLPHDRVLVGCLVVAAALALLFGGSRRG